MRNPGLHFQERGVCLWREACVYGGSRGRAIVVTGHALQGQTPSLSHQCWQQQQNPPFCYYYTGVTGTGSAVRTLPMGFA